MKTINKDYVNHTLLGCCLIVACLFLSNFNSYFYSIWDQHKLNWISLIATMAVVILVMLLLGSKTTNTDINDTNKITISAFVKIFGPFLFFYLIRVTLMLINVGFDNSVEFVPDAKVVGVEMISGSKGVSQSITIKYNKTGEVKTLEASAGIAVRYDYKINNKVFKDPLNKGFLGIIYHK